MRTITPLLLLSVALLAAAAHAQLLCTVQEVHWVRQADNRTYAAELDVLAGRPVMLELNAIELAPATVSRCAHDQRRDDVRLGWEQPGGGSLPFFQGPISCDDQRPLAFGVSNLASELWGASRRSVQNDALFAPQEARIDMLTATYSVRQTPQRWRRLHLDTASGSVRAPLGSLLVHVCVLESDAPATLPDGARITEAPRLLPLADCVRAFGGHCGVNVGYANSAGAPIELRRHSDANRLHPSSLENGWTLPSRFEPGLHRPDSMRRHWHLGWACDSGLDDPEAKWHLDGRTLHLDLMARRCSDASGEQRPGATFSWYQSAEDRLAAARAGNDEKFQAHAQTQHERPHVQQISQADAERAWRQQHVAQPYMSQTNKLAHDAADYRQHQQRRAHTKK